MKAPGTAEAQARIRGAVAHMRATSKLVISAPWLDAIADMIETEANIRHERHGRRSRGILGGYVVQCSCGSSSIEPDGVAKPCDRLARVLAVAATYLPELEAVR